MRKIIIPPIKIQGIKTKLVEWIIGLITFEIKGRWIEPFMGSEEIIFIMLVAERLTENQ